MQVWDKSDTHLVSTLLFQDMSLNPLDGWTWNQKHSSAECFWIAEASLSHGLNPLGVVVFKMLEGLSWQSRTSPCSICQFIYSWKQQLLYGPWALPWVVEIIDSHPPRWRRQRWSHVGWWSAFVFSNRVKKQHLTKTKKPSLFWLWDSWRRTFYKIK